MLLAMPSGIERVVRCGVLLATGAAVLSGCSTPEPTQMLDDSPALITSARLNAGPAGMAQQGKLSFGPAPVGLRLEIERTDDKITFEPGAPIALNTVLVNDSERAIAVVLPDDGSQYGWREPKITYSATLTHGSQVQRVPAHIPVASCGNYDEAWDKDVKQLGPKTRTKLSTWTYPASVLDLQQPGAVSLRAHYQYRAGLGRQGDVAVPKSLLGQAPFELVSNAVSLQVVRPLDLRLMVVGSMVVDTQVQLAKVFKLQIHNRSDRARFLASPFTSGADSATLTFEVDNKPNMRSPHVDWDGEQPGERKQLPAGSSDTILGEGQIFSARPQHWQVDTPGTVRVRARYAYSKEDYSILSNWVTVIVRSPKSHP